MIDDPLLNCMTAVCCPQETAQIRAHASALVKYGICKEADEAEAIATFYVKHFDFAEKGTLKPLVESILRLAGVKR